MNSFAANLKAMLLRASLCLLVLTAISCSQKPKEDVVAVRIPAHGGLTTASIGKVQQGLTCGGTALTVSSPVASSGTATNATDANSGTFWTPSSGANPQWIYVDLGADRNISRVQLDWDATTYDGYYSISVATSAAGVGTAEGATWTSIYAQSLENNATSHTDNITDLNFTGRYVRVFYVAKTHFTTPVAVKLREFKVFGDTDTACTANTGYCGTTSTAVAATYQNNGAGNTCAAVNGGAACTGTT
ncbi:MAG TPA: discoidin domain-containing protein, partial [Polyangiaceae bacterium]|nr:discoidin domain-containing protein [Polyangiaceae bacterium]